MDAVMEEKEEFVDGELAEIRSAKESPPLTPPADEEETALVVKSEEDDDDGRDPSPDSKSPEKARKWTDVEGEDFLEEEIIDGFAIVSFQTRQDLLKFDNEEKEKQRKAEEEERKRREKELEKERQIAKPVPRKPRRSRNHESGSPAKAKEGDLQVYPGMAIKRSAEDPVKTITKVPKLEPPDETTRKTHSVPDRVLSPSQQETGAWRLASALCSPRSASSSFPSTRPSLDINSHPSDPGHRPSVLETTRNGPDSLARPPFPNHAFPFLSPFPGLPPLGFPSGYGFMGSGLMNPMAGIQTSSALSAPNPPLRTPSASSQHNSSSGSQKKTGKWCAMHVRIAWDIYKQEYQKKRLGTDSNNRHYPPSAHSRTSSRPSSSAANAPVSSAEKDRPLPLLSESAVERHRNELEHQSRGSGEEPSTGGSLSNGAATERSEMETRDPMAAACSLPFSVAFNHSLVAAPSMPSSSASTGFLFRPPIGSLSAMRPGGVAPDPLAPSGLLRPPLPGDPSSSGVRMSLHGLPMFHPGFLDPRLMVSGLTPGNSMAFMDPYSLAARQRQLEAVTSSFFEKEQRDREEMLRRQQQQQQVLLGRNSGAFPPQMDSAGALTGLLERELLERQRLLMGGGVGMPGQPSISAPYNPLAMGLPTPGLLPQFPAGMESLMRTGALPGVPNAMAFANPMLGLGPTAAKLPTPFSNTLEQLARQKRDFIPSSEHFVNR